MRRTMHVPQDIYEVCEIQAQGQRMGTGEPMTWQDIAKQYIVEGSQLNGYLWPKDTIPEIVQHYCPSTKKFVKDT